MIRHFRFDDVRHGSNILGHSLGRLSKAKQVQVLLSRVIAKLVVGDGVALFCVLLSLLEELVSLLPLPEASHELDLVDIVLTPVGAVLHELIKISTLKLGLHEVGFRFLERLNFLL